MNSTWRKVKWVHSAISSAIHSNMCQCHCLKILLIKLIALSYCVDIGMARYGPFLFVCSWCCKLRIFCWTILEALINWPFLERFTTRERVSECVREREQSREGDMISTWAFIHLLSDANRLVWFQFQTSLLNSSNNNNICYAYRIDRSTSNETIGTEQYTLYSLLST